MLAQFAARLRAGNPGAGGNETGGDDGDREGGFGPVMVDDNCSVSLHFVSDESQTET